ncbi:hypothetical protein [Trinickia dinghuensis]|uniref:Uncharacterized protein n=1 Tax=Trinickia dinghuensis TaxID=2291023 RepID=A0A3D8JUY9_9BURK|nr:hypothetical protein [Trinickia dinghuensis]RDU96943.1 hypothetical protein DWV00_19985 [Trinickia dinghuensis]
MTKVLEQYAAYTAAQGRAAQWAAQAGVAFAFEKRKIDAEHALSHVEGHVRTELINALRNLGQQLRP